MGRIKKVAGSKHEATIVSNNSFFPDQSSCRALELIPLFRNCSHHICQTLSHDLRKSLSQSFLPILRHFPDHGLSPEVIFITGSGS